MFYILYISTVLDLHKELSHHYEAYTEKAGYDSHWNILYGMQDIRMWLIIYFIYRKYVLKIAHRYAPYREKLDLILKPIVCYARDKNVSHHTSYSNSLPHFPCAFCNIHSVRQMIKLLWMLLLSMISLQFFL